MSGRPGRWSRRKQPRNPARGDTSARDCLAGSCRFTRNSLRSSYSIVRRPLSSLEIPLKSVAHRGMGYALGRIMDRRPGSLTLRIEQEEVQEVLTRAADVLALVDARGRLLQVNRQACRTLGYSLSELTHLTLFDLDPQLDPPQFDDLRRVADAAPFVASQRRFRC